jgi:hypothetical protein
MDGAAGFSAAIGLTEIDGAIVTPVNVMVGSSAISRPAQPGWLSTTLGS